MFDKLKKKNCSEILFSLESENNQLDLTLKICQKSKHTQKRGIVRFCGCFITVEQRYRTHARTYARIYVHACTCRLSVVYFKYDKCMQRSPTNV